MKIWGSNYLTTDAGDLWTSWASLDKHHWTHLSRSDMASRSGIGSRSDIVGRSDIQSVGSVFLLVLTRLSVRSNGIYICIYIYIYIYIYISREGVRKCVPSRAGLTRSQKVSQGLTRPHKQGPSRCHKVSQGPTRSHKVSQSLGLLATV